MEEKTKQCGEKNDRINELENELSAIRLVYKIRDVDFAKIRAQARSRVKEGKIKIETLISGEKSTSTEKKE
jgi:hypothetical protein